MAFCFLEYQLGYLCYSMRQFLAILLFFSVSCQMVAKMGIIAWFGANRTFVAKELCENKNRPEKKCAGKCYLKKQLNKIDGEEQRSSEQSKKQKTELPEYLAVIPVPGPVVILSPRTTPYSLYINNYFHIAASRIFHPPPAC